MSIPSDWHNLTRVRIERVFFVYLMLALFLCELNASISFWVEVGGIVCWFSLNEKHRASVNKHADDVHYICLLLRCIFINGAAFTQIAVSHFTARANCVFI